MKSNLLPKREIILAILQENGETISDEESFSFSRIGKGKGLASLLFKVLIGDRRYAVKITDPRSNLEGFEDKDIHLQMHNREVHFYHWASTLSETDLSNFKLPKYFGGRYCSRDEEGILILEDFSEIMISEIDFFSGFSIDLVKEIIQSIVGYQTAYLHVNTQFPTRHKKDVYEPLVKLAREAIDSLPEKSFITENTKKFANCIIDSGLTYQLSNLRCIADDVEKLVEQYPEFAKNALPMLIHSDLWPNNMLYEKIGDDHLLLAIIDWQCVTVGNALFDVSILCSLNLTAEVRRANEQQLINYYWREIKKSCGKQFNIDLETARKLYRHCMRWSAIMMIIMMHLRNMTPKTPESTSRDKQLSERLQGLLEDIVEE